MPSLIADNQDDYALQEYAAEISMDGIERCSDFFLWRNLVDSLIGVHWYTRKESSLESFRPDRAGNQFGCLLYFLPKSTSIYSLQNSNIV